jgi:hypothetical protein
MTKLQRIDEKIAEFNELLSAVYEWMEDLEKQELIDWADTFSQLILSKISKLEVSRHEARIMQHWNAGRYDNDEGDFIS